MTWRLAVDIGGTFTDIVALEETSGALHLAKVQRGGFQDALAGRGSGCVCSVASNVL